MVTLIIAVFALAIVLEATGHVAFRGRLLLIHTYRWCRGRLRSSYASPYAPAPLRRPTPLPGARVIVDIYP